MAPHTAEGCKDGLELTDLIISITIVKRWLNLQQAPFAFCTKVSKRILDLAAKHALIPTNQILVDYRDVSRPATSKGPSTLRKVQVNLFRFRNCQPTFPPEQHRQSLDEQRLHRCFGLKLGYKVIKQSGKKIVVFMPRDEMIAEDAVSRRISTTCSTSLGCPWPRTPQRILPVGFRPSSACHSRIR